MRKQGVSDNIEDDWVVLQQPKGGVSSGGVEDAAAALARKRPLVTPTMDNDDMLRVRARQADALSRARAPLVSHSFTLSRPPFAARYGRVGGAGTRTFSPGAPNGPWLARSVNRRALQLGEVSAAVRMFDFDTSRAVEYLLSGGASNARSGAPVAGPALLLDLAGPAPTAQRKCSFCQTNNGPERQKCFVCDTVLGPAVQ